LEGDEKLDHSRWKGRKTTPINLERGGKLRSFTLEGQETQEEFTIDLPLRKQLREKPYFGRVYG
jgi:hypothetical protein